MQLEPVLIEPLEHVASGLPERAARYLPMLDEGVNELREDDAAASPDIGAGLDRELLRLRPRLSRAERRPGLRNLSPVDANSCRPARVALTFPLRECGQLALRSPIRLSDGIAAVPIWCHSARKAL